ncbi:MAG TPA: ATP-dependent DNA helicase UvrD2 [Actinomycetota bacterium]|nr:ATP-dependent DNA helicase UvrD2 [Actinomycetota bacterium]
MVSPEGILAPLNDEQREAATTVRGPVAILAGAGTGKTTAITHRIAYQVATRTFTSAQILAVTFTEKAAGELRARLGRLGVSGVEARTFHAAALSQLSRAWPTHVGSALPDILDHKAPLIASLANGLPPPHRFMPRGELATEIEWAKNRLIPPSRYLDELTRTGHEPPIPAEMMHRVYDGYERRKTRAERIDFEDMLRLAVELFDERPASARELHDRLHAFTVDEYQDVNTLQHELLLRWLGGRDDVCVVGDDYQTIYTFTGASPRHLLSFPERYPTATVVRLETNYRSSPQVLAVANRLATRLGGFRKELKPTRPDGPNPTARGLPGPDDEVAFVVAEAQRLIADGVPPESVAVIYRINARSEPYEEAFAKAGIAYQVRDGSFLRRPGPRGVLARLRRAGAGAGVADAVVAVTDALGYSAEADPDADDEVTRQADLARLRSLAAEYTAANGGAGSIEGFVTELTARFHTEKSGRGVQLLTYHRAKGLEFDVVFLPRLLDRELPFRSQRSAADPDEERRLFYVGITRARTHLYLSWPRDPKTSPSPFLRELGVISAEPLGRSTRGSGSSSSRPRVTAPSNGPLFDRLKAWRRERASADGVPAYVVFKDATLAEIAERKPSTRGQLADVTGVGPAKLERYADEVLAVVATA